VPRLGRVPAIRLGAFLVPMPLTQFTQNTSGIFATSDIAGTIGAQMLRRFTVIFDYAHREMPKPRSSTKMSETDKTRVMIVLVFMVRPFFP